VIKKIISSQSKSITGAAIVLAAASFISRLIGVLRDRIFAHTFGASDTLDIYYAAFRIPDFVYNLIIVGALSAGFIPVFMSLYVKSKKKAWVLTNNILNILGLSLTLLCVLLFFATPYLMHYIVPGFSAEKLEKTIMLTRVMFLSPILLGISGIFSGVLQSLKSFFIYALTPIVYNLGIIIGVIFFVPYFGLPGLAWGVILGAFFHLLIQIPTLFHHGFSYKWSLNFSNTHVKKMGALMIPRTLTIGTTQLNFLVITIIASTLSRGSVTVFNFANNLQYFPIGLIGISFSLAAFPTLSKLYAEKKETEFIEHLVNVVKQILFFIIPLTLIFLLLRAQIVRVVLGSGAFDWNATIATANTLGFFALSLFAQCLIPLLMRAFYAMHNTWTPLSIAFIGSLVNIIASLLLKNEYGIAGLALAFSIAMIVQFILLWFSLRYKLKTLLEEEIIHGFYKISVAAIAMGITIQATKQTLSTLVDMNRFWGVLTQAGIATLLGVLVYGFICSLLRLREMRLFTASFQKRFLKRSSAQAVIREADDI